MVFQGASGHGLVDQQPLVPVCAVADDVDEVLVVEMAEHGDPGQERLVVLEAVLVQLLDGHGLGRGRERCLVRSDRAQPNIFEAQSRARKILARSRTCSLFSSLPL